METQEQLTGEQITNIMETIRNEYKETPIDTKIPALKNLIKKLNERGFNFDPFSLVKEIDAEADKQFKKLTADTLSGLTVGALSAIKNEVITWYNDEEVRFEAFRTDYLKKKAEEDESQVELLAEVTPIKSAKSSTKHGKAVKTKK
jgi:hypothetical protein